MKKEDILEAIRRTAAANGGKPLGKRTFLKETGIQESDWLGKNWVRWSDAVREAGFEPNTRQQSLGKEALILKLVELTRELGHIPTIAELRFKIRQEHGFPWDGTFTSNIGPKPRWPAALIQYCQTRIGYEDIIAICRKIPAATSSEEVFDQEDGDELKEGWVYLMKSGRHYKIGRTADLVRRHGQLSIQLPEALEMVHQIRTDDVFGIEQYWHKRFEAKRRKGEWFALSHQDVRAFKRRKFM